MFAIVWLTSLLVAPRTPLDLAKSEIARAVGSRASDVAVAVRPGVKESFQIVGDGRKVTITGGDSVGAMYGAFEFAERLQSNPGSAWKSKIDAKPFLPDRGLNLFLTLPWDYKKNNTDYEIAALTDPKRWWFANDDYWRTLLDLMARSRLNWLDIHGGWDISVTNAPNLYAYFVTSPSFPLVGVPQEVKDQNLRQLNHVVEMAHERGIRVSLMCYEANLKIPQNPNPPYQATEANIYKYTKEVVEQMIRRLPGLDAIGYRIGESGHGENFFTCYTEAVKASGRDIPIVTRSWITRKQKVLPLARASKDFTVEIKYNGEQWGAPYPVMGGRMAKWQSYSFEDYLSDSGKPGAKTWQGWPAEGGGNWPSEPYKVVWQVRANGTHRIFPFYNPDWVRRSIQAMKIGTASGYTIEGEDAYYPKSPDYYLANLGDKYCDWIHQRDEMYWMTWGRLGYDPTTPDATFDAKAKQLLGTGSEKLVEDWKKASTWLPMAYLAYALGPDHRDHAPELEWGGDTTAYVQGGGFDPLVFTPINESFANKATGGIDGRKSVFSFAESYASANRTAEEVRGWLTSPNARVREIANAVEMMSWLAIYQRDREFAANSMASFEFSSNPRAREDAAAKLADAAARYGQMADNAYYRPFTERLRMHTNTYSWKDELAKVKAEAAKYPISTTNRSDSGSGQKSSATNHPSAKLSWRTEGSNVVATLEGADIEKAWLLVKPLPSTTGFHRVPMSHVGKAWTVRFKREKWGHAIAAETLAKGVASRVPDVVTSTPYLVIPSQPGATPQFYSAEEAMTFLNPKVLDPAKYGALLIGSRAGNFFGRFDRSTKRKLLDPVQRGMRLVILQEDFNKDKLDFLPKPPRLETFQSRIFDPGGQLGLEKVEVDGIMWHRFLPGDGWEVFGNGGLARLKIGKGEVWVTTARLMQSMVNPGAAKAFVKLLSVGGKVKPTVVIDACTEGGPFTSTCHEDLMNSHDIPFLTLGEVIAQDQGMDSFTPVPGPTMNDDVLGGKGTDMANRFLRGRVIEMSKIPAPPSVEAFEKLRIQRRKELMRSLGLDPLPAKTPLNARITGTIQRDGYRIEKLVFESRPNFFVTGHVYVPDAPHTQLPVIMNVNGHWAHKKDEDRIQLRCAFQALSGYIAIAIDSPGWSFEGNSLIERRAEGNHNDWSMVEGGSNTTGYYVWDAIRALDYMASRSDTDMQHVGITGASGGGLATLYTFAADDRYSAAVPVVYMASLELAPDNGCLCNHVPGTCLIGDRSDVMAIQAPKPVYIMGAQNDGEFPPDATRLTAKKLRDNYKLFGKDADVYDQIFGGGHDYNQLMREASIGFFNRYLKGQGDGSPVPQPALQAIDPQDRQLLALDPPAPNERTQRDLSKEYLRNAPTDVPIEQVIAINGGRPAKTPMNYKEIGSGEVRVVTFESEPGLLTPGILFMPKGKVTGVRIVVSDTGKAMEIEGAQSASAAAPGIATLYIDAIGTGELGNIEMRYAIYAGRSFAFTAGWQVVRAAEAMRAYSPHIDVVGHGPMCSQAVMYAGLLDPTFDHVTGTNCMKSWLDAFDDGFPSIAVQPRAHLCGSLENLRKHVQHSQWHVRS